MKKLILVCLFLSTPVWAADYTISTTTAARERALNWEAKRSGKTGKQVLQDLADRYLDNVMERAKEAREKSFSKGYEKATPEDKAIIDKIIGPLP